MWREGWPGLARYGEFGEFLVFREWEWVWLYGMFVWNVNTIPKYFACIS